MDSQVGNVEAGASSSRWLNLALLVTAVGGVLGLAVPALSARIPGCVFHQITGLYCPGCGTGRALQALMRGDVAEALGHNALLVVGLVPLTYAFARETLSSFGARVPARIVTGLAGPVALFVLIVAFWVLRNVPGWPGAALAP